MGSRCLTVDYEYDWGGRKHTTHAIEKNVPIVLDALSRLSAKATFFVSTEILARTKDIVLEIHREGHEVASHGHDHLIKYDLLSRRELFDQIQKSKIMLEDLIGERVVGFRTPMFRKSEFTEEVLLELGFGYDSSSVEVSLPGRYRSLQFRNRVLPEFPVSSVFGVFPAGLKWINLLLQTPPQRAPVFVSYVHLFDLLSMKETFFESEGVSSILTKSFYCMRFGDMMNTFNAFAAGSKCMRGLLNESGSGVGRN
jgi:peptidoglycan/xylan/chitin deacetylase (PgdA/CDA1 family)